MALDIIKITRIASFQGVNANVLATTTLTYDTHPIGVVFTAANTLGLFCFCTYATGTMSLIAVDIKLNGNSQLSGVQSLASMTTSKFIRLPLSAIAVDTLGNYTCQVTTINGSAATFNVEIWGVYNG